MCEYSLSSSVLKNPLHNSL